MSLIKFLLVVSGILVSLGGVAEEPDRIGDFALLDHQGKHHQLSWYGDQRAIVIFVQGNGSALVREGVPVLAKNRDEFASQGVAFFMLNSVLQDTRQSIAKEADQLGYDIPILVDEAQLVAEALGVTRVAETLVIDPKSMTLIYRGPIDGLNSVLSGEAMTEEIPAGTGALIAYQSREQHRLNSVSYTKDIVPILENNCVSCHHEGGIGPWSMSSYDMVRGWSLMMKQVVMTRRMPPGQIDLHVSKPLQEVAGLTTQEQQQLVHWIDAGAPLDDDVKAGEADDPLTALTFDDPRYSLGQPDMIFKVPAQTIPATGVVDYRYVPVELNLDRDIWVQAMEFVPGDRKVLHHVIAYLSSPADKTVRGRENGAARGDSVGGFAPGRQADSFRDNSGRLITKGSNLLLQMHYTTSGKEAVDETEVGIFIHEKPPAYIMAGGVAGQRRFMVPPNAKEHKLEGEQLIERDAYLYDMTPHMHFRGKYMNYSAVYPDGTSELLLSVPKYDFNWQFNYALKDPLFLPAGTRLVARGAMDNSDRNPSNPDPSMPVHFGLQTKHEMFFGFTTFRYVGDTPESLVGDKPSSEDDVAGL